MKYKIVAIDPPWPVKKLTHRDRPNQTTMDYPIMSVEQIKQFPIEQFVDEDSLVFLWTTQKFLFTAKDVLESWNFKHLLTMVWEKTYGRSAGMPLYGFRWNAEFILVGYRKAPPTWPKQPLIPAVFQAENIRHSQKPDRFYQMVETLGSPRIDLFARQAREGWAVWGNEVDSNISLTV